MNLDDDSPDGALSGELLFICTANVSRSPTAELLLKHQLSAALCTGMYIHSSGVRASVDSPIDPIMAALLKSDGIDSSAFRARQLTSDQLQRATVILTATAEHRSHVARRQISARAKTFTMIEFAQLLESTKRSTSSGNSLSDCLERANAARFSGGGSLRQLDIQDPYGCSGRVYRSALKSLRHVTTTIAHALEGG